MVTSYKVVRDPIHGNLNIPKDFFKIIDDPVFQRLRLIKQLSFTHYVYPGAVHTRFEHSLGVANYVGIYIDNIINNTRRFIIERMSNSGGNQCMLDGETDIKNFFENVINELQRLRNLFMMAGLLHDVGHMLYSHVFEGVHEDIILMSINDIIDVSRLGESNLPQLISTISESMRINMALHEYLGTVIVDSILADKIDSIDFGLVNNNLENIENDESRSGNEDRVIDRAVYSSFIKNFLSYTYSRRESYLINLVNNPVFTSNGVDEHVAKAVIEIASRILSGSIDADRSDYMNRDSYYTGKPTGGFDVDRLLSTMVAMLTPIRESRGIHDMAIGVVDKGVASVELMLLSRVYLYKDVYLHAVSLAYSGIARRLLSLLTIAAFSDDQNEECGSVISKFLDCVRTVLTMQAVGADSDGVYEDSLSGCLSMLTDDTVGIVLEDILNGRGGRCVAERLRAVLEKSWTQATSNSLCNGLSINNKSYNIDEDYVWAGMCVGLIGGAIAVRYRKHWPFLYLEGNDAKLVLQQSIIHDIKKEIEKYIVKMGAPMANDTRKEEKKEEQGGRRGKGTNITDSYLLGKVYRDIIPFTVLGVAKYSAYDSSYDKKRYSRIYVYLREEDRVCGKGEVLSKDRELPGITKLVIDQLDGEIYSKILILNPFLTRSIVERNPLVRAKYKFKEGKLRLGDVDGNDPYVEYFYRRATSICGLSREKIREAGMLSANCVVDYFAPNIL